MTMRKIWIIELLKGHTKTLKVFTTEIPLPNKGDILSFDFLDVSGEYEVQYNRLVFEEDNFVHVEIYVKEMKIEKIGD